MMNTGPGGSYGSRCCKCGQGAGGIVHVCQNCKADHCSTCATVTVVTNGKVKLSSKCHKCGGTQFRTDMRVY